jgi:hypothetical protein
MAAEALALRDIHVPASAPWWPPAPGWWLLAALVLAIGAIACVWRLRRRRHRAAAARLFDDGVATHDAPSARVAAISELLRRAARRLDPGADRLEGDAWLAFLDADTRATAFSQGPGRVLLDGAFRRTVDDDAVRALLPLARARYLALMTARRR